MELNFVGTSDEEVSNEEVGAGASQSSLYQSASRRPRVHLPRENQNDINFNDIQEDVDTRESAARVEQNFLSPSRLAQHFEENEAENLLANDQVSGELRRSQEIHLVSDGTVESNIVRHVLMQIRLH